VYICVKLLSEILNLDPRPPHPKNTYTCAPKERGDILSQLLINHNRKILTPLSWEILKVVNKIYCFMNNARATVRIIFSI